MKLLSVTAQKPHSTGSGVYLTELVKGFAQMGIEQAVVAGVYREDTVELPEGVGFVPVYFKSEQLPFPIPGMSDEMPYESTVYSRMTPDMAERFQEAFLEALQSVIKEWRPDVILCHHLYLLTALVREKFPDRLVVGICHGTGLRQIKKTSLKSAYIKENIGRLDLILALHKEQARDIASAYGVCHGKIRIAGSGYNDGIFMDMCLDKPRNQVKLIYAGKLSEKKGVMSLIKSLDGLDGGEGAYALSLAGGAGNHKEYEEICRLAGECRYPVSFLGRLDQRDLAKEFNKSHIFVLPSFYEGLPLVIIEALACGLSVVATDLPGIGAWMDQNIPGHGIRFVRPPKMVNTDEADPDSLPGFELRLAEAIEAASIERAAIEGESIERAAIEGAAIERAAIEEAAIEGAVIEGASIEGAEKERKGMNLQLCRLSWAGICEKILGWIEEAWRARL